MSFTDERIIDHIGLTVSDLARAKAFYTKALAPLGIVLVAEFPASVTGGSDVLGFGKGQKGEFWLSGGPRMVPHVHVAFIASSRGVVDALYAAALAAGGTDNGAPGVRGHYLADYYGAFVRDPDGHNIEAVCHAKP